MDFDERQKFAELLAGQKSVYVDMRDILKRQAQALQKGDTEKLLKLMEDVNQSRSRASALQDDIEPLREQWEKDREQIPESERQVLLQMVEDIRSILSEVLESMNHLHGDVNERKDETKQKMEDMHRANQARKGYNVLENLPKSPRFMDRKE
jgi:hypothetical protein